MAYQSGTKVKLIQYFERWRHWSYEQSQIPLGTEFTISQAVLNERNNQLIHYRVEQNGFHWPPQSLAEINDTDPIVVCLSCGWRGSKEKLKNIARLQCPICLAAFCHEE